MHLAVKTQTKEKKSDSISRNNRCSDLKKKSMDLSTTLLTAITDVLREPVLRLVECGLQKSRE